MIYMTLRLFFSMNVGFESDLSFGFCFKEMLSSFIKRFWHDFSITLFITLFFFFCITSIIFIIIFK
jgi:hypothetical protein